MQHKIYYKMNAVSIHWKKIENFIETAIDRAESRIEIDQVYLRLGQKVQRKAVKDLSQLKGSIEGIFAETKDEVLTALESCDSGDTIARSELCRRLSKEATRLLRAYQYPIWLSYDRENVRLCIKADLAKYYLRVYSEHFSKFLNELSRKIESGALPSKNTEHKKEKLSDSFGFIEIVNDRARVLKESGVYNHLKQAFEETREEASRMTGRSPFTSYESFKASRSNHKKLTG